MSDDFNAFAHLKAAATGDITAQRLLAEAAVQMAVDCGPDLDPMPFVQDGLVFARLAAAHGEAADKGRLLSMLAVAAEICSPDCREEYAGEALALAETLADEGNELIGDLLPMIAEQTTAGEMQAAMMFKERMAAQ